MRPGKAPDRFSDKLREGFCLGCGGKTRWVKNHYKRFGRDGDTLNWHRACYSQFLRRWTTGLEAERSYEHVCRICGKRFTAAGRGAWIRLTCSEGCRREHTRQRVKARSEGFRARPLVRRERACAVCGKRYLVGRGLGRASKKTCSPACRRERKRRLAAAWYKRRRRPLILQRFTCVICGKRFSVKSPTVVIRKTCSIPCRYLNHSRGRAAWREGHPGRKKKVRQRAGRGE